MKKFVTVLALVVTLVITGITTLFADDTTVISKIIPAIPIIAVAPVAHYDIYVNRLSCRVDIYKNDVWNKWFSCDVGKPSTPTISGTFYTGTNNFSFGTNAYLVKYATVISGNYCFHSVLFDRYGNYIIDGRLGLQISHGCIRLAVENARWMCQNIPKGTRVVIR